VQVRPGAVLAGVVVDDAGRPAGELTVQASRDGNFVDTRPRATDADGRFELIGLESGRWDVMVWGDLDGHPRNSRLGGFPAGGPAGRLVGPRSRAVDGVLVDEEGKPISGVPVHFAPIEEPGLQGAGTWQTQAETDEKGRFSVALPPTTRYRLQLVND